MNSKADTHIHFWISSIWWSLQMVSLGWLHSKLWWRRHETHTKLHKSHSSEWWTNMYRTKIGTNCWNSKMQRIPLSLWVALNIWSWFSQPVYCDSHYLKKIISFCLLNRFPQQVYYGSHYLKKLIFTFLFYFTHYFSTQIYFTSHYLKDEICLFSRPDFHNKSIMILITWNFFFIPTWCLQ